MFGRPGNQPFGRITPPQPEGRLQDGLRPQTAREEECKKDGRKDGAPSGRFSARQFAHAGSIPRSGRFRKPRTRRRGFALIEATLAMSLLSVVGLMLMKISLNVIHPRQYALQQVLSDSYLTFERSTAERIPFESLLAADSPWPAYPAIATATVEMGKLPGGVAVTGDIARTRIADAGNYPVDGGVGTVAVNPAAMKIWRVQSVLRYTISGRTYVKSRTVVRAQ